MSPGPQNTMPFRPCVESAKSFTLIITPYFQPYPKAYPTVLHNVSLKTVYLGIYACAPSMYNTIPCFRLKLILIKGPYSKPFKAANLQTPHKE